MKRHAMQAWSLAAVLLGCNSEPEKAPAEPGPLAREIHEQGEYPDTIEIAEAPRWTMATVLRLGLLASGDTSGAGSGASASGGTVSIRGQVVGSAGQSGGAVIIGGSSSGAQLGEAGTEQPSGGQVSDPEDGWDTDGWAEPQPAPAEVVALDGSGGVGSLASAGASSIELMLEPGDCEASGPCPGGQPQAIGVQAGSESIASGQTAG